MSKSSSFHLCCLSPEALPKVAPSEELPCPVCPVLLSDGLAPADDMGAADLALVEEGAGGLPPDPESGARLEGAAAVCGRGLVSEATAGGPGLAKAV